VDIGDGMRDWVRDFGKDLAAGFRDWDAFCQNPSGCRVEVGWEETEPDLPQELEKARERLARWVPDETPERGHGGAFNGPRYCLSRVERDLRWAGEEIGCRLVFRPSDYRTFLVTNGLEPVWAKRAGVEHIFENPHKWAARWTGLTDSSGFYENSFGINVLVSVIDHGRRVAVFRERGARTAVRSHSTVGTVDEGLRRRYGERLFDETSNIDPRPDIWRAVYRAVEEEAGITVRDSRDTRPILLSVGRVKSTWQPAALLYWPLPFARAKFQAHLEASQERNYEFGRHHYVEFTEEGLKRFILEQESKAPVETWVAAMGLYSLRSSMQPKVFLSHSHKDKRFVRVLGRFLKSRGIHVWIDEAEIGIGESVLKKLSEATHMVDYVVAVISKASVRSKWVSEELEMAMTDEVTYGALKVLPVVKDNCELPDYLRHKLFADCRKPHLRPREKERLAATIQSGR
jgi:hypothetical protein